METESVLVEKGGDTYTRVVGSAFFVGQGNWGGPKGENIWTMCRRYFKANLNIGPATVNFPPPEGKKPDAVHTYQTNAESALLYRYIDPLVNVGLLD